jgi:hypothetical protein
MISEIPASAFEIPQYALWMIAGWVLTTLISGFCGYRWGLRSQKEAARLKARNEVLAIIERILADIDDDSGCWNPHSRIRGELRSVTIKFYSQFSVRIRARIKKALDSYHALYCSAWEWPKKGTPERAKFDQEHQAQIDGLERLRNEISNT